MPPIGVRLRRLPRDVLTMLAFFSRLPIPAPREPFDMRESAAAWPLAGAVLALGPAGLFWVMAYADAPPLLAALGALALLAALTGALHEDGLADTADGLGGGRQRQGKLAIMRDSRIGTFGVLALAFTIGGKAAALAALAAAPGLGALLLLAAAVLSRALALWHWRAIPPARPDGLAAAAGQPDPTALLIGAGTGALAAEALLAGFALAGLFAVTAAVLAVILFTRLCARQIGGHTGDTIGAAQQIAETALVVGVVATGTPSMG